MVVESAEGASHHAPPYHGRYQEGLTREAGDRKRSRRDLFSASCFCLFNASVCRPWEKSGSTFCPL